MIWIGVYPDPFLRPMHASVGAMVTAMRARAPSSELAAAPVVDPLEIVELPGEPDA